MTVQWRVGDHARGWTTWRATRALTRTSPRSGTSRPQNERVIRNVARALEARRPILLDIDEPRLGAHPPAASAHGRLGTTAAC